MTAIQATEQRRHFVHWSGMRPLGPLLWSQHLGPDRWLQLLIIFCEMEGQARSHARSSSKSTALQPMIQLAYLRPIYGAVMRNFVTHTQTHLLGKHRARVYFWLHNFSSQLQSIDKRLKIPPCQPAKFLWHSPWQHTGFLLRLSVGPLTGRKRYRRVRVMDTPKGIAGTTLNKVCQGWSGFVK